MRVRYVPYILLAAITVALMAATFVEKEQGHAIAINTIYASWWLIALWGATAISGLWLIVKVRLFHRPATLLLHLALLCILIGALTTHFLGQQGTIHLRKNNAVSLWQTSEGQTIALPFTVSLRTFNVENYPGTQSPMDYVSVIDIADDNQTHSNIQISMNHIGEYHGYRFYQSGYDDDGKGTILSVSHDPWGIGITYTGYALSLLSMLLLLILPNEGFRRLLRMPLMRQTALLMLLLSVGCECMATPRTLPKETAEYFSDLYIYYNGRICPLQTMARDFVTKIYGKPDYKGFTPEQVLMGYIFYPQDWSEEPFIKVKGKARKLIGLHDGSHASLRQFADHNGYKLQHAMTGIRTGRQVDDARSIVEADEKINILEMYANLEPFKLFPHQDGQQLTWYSPADGLANRLPADIGDDERIFITRSIDYMLRMVVMKHTDQLQETVSKIKVYQQKQAAGMLPDSHLFQAEQLYNRIERIRPLAMLMLTAGLIAFLLYLHAWLRRRKTPRWAAFVTKFLLIASFGYLLTIVCLRGYVSQHLPLTNGCETMLTMTLLTLLLTLLMQHHYRLIIPFGMLLSGLTLLVAMMSNSNPQITPLMPVLSSPLLSIHVCVIMLAYSLLAFTMLNGLTALVLLLGGNRYNEQVAQLMRISQLLLYPAVFCLAAGIFIGAIWANISWGTYWSWDPKETWALITFMIYAIAVHDKSLPFLRSPRQYHLFMVLAFLSILMTYFGVNYFLGGMHSYA